VKPEGESILALLKGNQGNADRTFCWEHEGNRAIRKGKWKLVSLGSGADHEWELYDIDADRVESHDLADAKPEIVKELSADYDRWAARCGVINFSEIRARRQAARSDNRD